MRTKAEALWNAAPARHQAQAVQKPRNTCASCGRFGLTVDAEPGRTVCRNCRDHQANYGCRPTERTCRRWDHLGVRDVLPGEILQAKAATKQRRRRTAS